MKINKKLGWSFLFYNWIIILAIFTTIPFSTAVEKQSETGFRLDYLEHFFFYSFIPVLFIFADGAYLNRIIRKKYYLLLLGLIFSSLTEIHQHFIPSRSFNPIDLGLNISGFIFGSLIGPYIHKLLIKLS